MTIENEKLGISFKVIGIEGFKDWIINHDSEVRAEVIDEFVKFAYVNGIGFSFMGKIKEDGTSDVPDKLNAIKLKFIEWLKEKKNGKRRNDG